LARKSFVLVVVVAALALIVWSGITNYRAHRAELADRRAHEIVLSPDGSASAGAADSMPPNPLQGKTAPNFTLEDTTGKKVSLSDYKGKAVLINFWATWCGPCKVEIPWFEKLHDQYASQGFEILGVSADELDMDDKAKLATEKAEVAKFATNMHINYPVLLDGDSLRSYGELDAYPTSFYIDRSGKVIDVITGLASKDEIEATIKKALSSGNA
jgi:cytochrome c biogenesis protein CcmG/thiol:disulfide interchange protein DsbE